MLKFLTSPKYRSKWKQLEEVEMIGLNFKNFKHFSIRSYINTLCRINSKEEFRELFEIFHSINKKKSPLQTLKILIFYHLMIQEVPSMCEDLLMPEIHKLQEQIQTNENFFRERRASGSTEKNLSHSVEKTVDWLKNKISKPKQIELRGPKSKNHSMKTQGSELMSKEQFVMVKIIQPYFSYIIRSLSLLSLYKKCQIHLTPETYQIWMIINIVKKLFEVSQSFTHIFRYYKQNLLDLLFVVRTMIVYEINFLYPVMKKKVDIQMEQFMQSYLKEYQRMGKDIKKIDHFIQQNKVKQLRNILQEISAINESIKLLFFGKYYANIKMLPETIPIILDTTHNSCDLLYHVLEVREKEIQRELRKKKQRKRSKTQMDESTSNVSNVTGKCMVGFKQLRRRNNQYNIPSHREGLKL